MNSWSYNEFIQWIHGHTMKPRNALQHCENYELKWETVHCYPRNVDRCCKWSERAVEGGLMLSLECQHVFQNLLVSCFATWQITSNLDVSLDFVSENIEILGKIKLTVGTLSVKCITWRSTGTKKIGQPLYTHAISGASTIVISITKYCCYKE